ncbi:hypothetical protein PIROE2DRAFT_68585 [Piromyces sp. E2]|nr:hypothetical protein PIROE2DRAFT_68585 [Piromyces sp. E2]|eukprot:OUM69188.1 hypothetical protein PIROE2DRAFT_68585 [Piromyces sp. E2]
MVKKKKLANTLARFQEKRKKVTLNEYNPLKSEKLNFLKKNKNKNHKQLSQKDFIPFTEEDSILFIGEGNFSFAKSVAELLPAITYKMVATCYDNETELKEKYNDAAENIEAIEDLGGKILYQVDATKLASLKHFKGKRFDKIVFNFPHVGAGIKDQDRNILTNQKLLQGFFDNASELLTSRVLYNDMNDGEILVTLKSGNPYDLWDIKKLAKSTGKLVTKTSYQFNPNLYPGYHHRRTIETGSPKGDLYAKSIITINNNSDSEIVGFKIKTTSPHNFCVRPSVGKILQNKKAEVIIYIKVQDLNAISSDKFLIQTTVIPNEFNELSDEKCLEKIGETFKKLEKLKRSSSNIANQLKEHRLLCDISALPNIKTDDTRKTININSPESPTSRDRNLLSPISPNITSAVKRNRASTSDKLPDPSVLERNPQNINEANALIKELENAIQKYSVDSLKNDLVKTRRYGKESINDSTADGKKEINDPKELFFEWNGKTIQKRKLPLDKSIQWPIAFLIVVISFIIGAYYF